mmetsp:Transcript_81956/g.213806  ORF Transcript_81956/g.213806 Transcript_81956/m.213806 type:complete len:167 (+) Transcript_81956:62-562(+)
MGGCESCASTRRKEVQMLLSEAGRSGTLQDLQIAIKEAEAQGVDSLAARQQYAEMARRERQSPESVHEMLRWAMSTQDGVILKSVIEEVASIAPDHADLQLAGARLAEFQQDVLHKLKRSASNKDPRSLAVMLERARHMGIPPASLEWASGQLRMLEEAHVVRRDR